jgi:3-hydroxyisobutyrate dehydrogenase-like beta-hydroxyacid dehydrogenase
MQAVVDVALVQSDLVLSIVPPGDAIAFAERMAPHLASATTKPVFIDCNAISPGTAARIAEIIAPTGAPFIDGGHNRRAAATRKQGAGALCLARARVARAGGSGAWA